MREKYKTVEEREEEKKQEKENKVAHTKVFMGDKGDAYL